MKQLPINLLYCLFLFITCILPVTAQTAANSTPSKEKPAIALLRHRETTSTIETVITAQLKDESSSSLTIYKKDGNISKRIKKSQNITNCDNTDTPGTICKDTTTSGKVRFVYYLTEKPEAAEKYWVSFSIIDAEKGEIEQLVNVSFDFEKVVPNVQYYDKEEVFNKVSNYENFNYKPNGEIIIPLRFPPPNQPSNKEFDEYINERIDVIYDYLETKIPSPESIAKVRIESLTKDNPPFEANVIGFRLTPDGRTTAQEGRFINIMLITDKKFPSTGFAFEVIFQNNPPPELSGKLINENKGFVTIEPTKASAILKDDTLPLREEFVSKVVEMIFRIPVFDFRIAIF